MKFIKALFACAAVMVSLSSNAAFIDFDSSDIKGFANQDVSGSSSVSDFGATLGLDGNLWVSITGPFNIDASSVLYFSFEALGNEAEIYGIGFDNDMSVTPGTLFDIGGSQSNRAIQYADYTVNSGVVDFAIDVGSFFTGTFSKMVFVLDADNIGNTSVFFRNVELCSDGDLCLTTLAQNSTQVSAPSTIAIFGVLLLASAFRRRA
jgi:hypothetical protein